MSKGSGLRERHRDGRGWIVEMTVNQEPATIQDCIPARRKRPWPRCICGHEVAYVWGRIESGVEKRFVAEYVFVPRDPEREKTLPEERRGRSGTHALRLHECEDTGNRIEVTYPGE